MNIAYVLNFSSYEAEGFIVLDLLWTAPELLQLKHRGGGTQAGDVYSFAIILYEINGRKGAYGNCNLSPKGVSLQESYIHIKHVNMMIFIYDIP